MKKIRPLGDVLLDLEEVLEEMVDAHSLQTGDVLALVKSWIDVHRPNAHEVYEEDDKNPEFYYGPKRS